jgi:MFS family permease
VIGVFRNPAFRNPQPETRIPRPHSETRIPHPASRLTVPRSSLAALSYRSFRLIWIGLLVSFTGSFMQNAALLWHVSLLVPENRKGLALGLVGLARVVPVVVFSLVSGVVADAWDRRRLMIGTQVGAATVALVLAGLTFGGLNRVWPIYLLSAVGAAVGAFDLPARQSLVPSLVPREHVPNAISLNTLMFQVASVGGPALGGVVISVTSVAWVYAINAMSFGVVVVALVMMRDVPRPAIPDDGRKDVSLSAALEGLRFVFHSSLIRSTMLLDFFATFFSSATALLPIYAQDILDVGPRGYGWLYAAPAVGALVTGAALVPLTDRIERRGLTLVWSVFVYGGATILFGASTSFWPAFAALALTGAGDTVSTVIRNIIRQLETPDRLRGRMVGVNMVFFHGGPQLGELEAGLVAQWLGAPFSVISGGIACLLTCGWVAMATPGLRAYRRSEHAETPPR